jgi:hypothetical protein
MVRLDWLDIEAPMADDDMSEVKAVVGRIILRVAEDNVRARMRLGLSRITTVYRNLLPQVN